MKTVFQNFAHETDGAVTVDWVVLTAGIIGLGAAVMVSVGSGTTDLANLTSTTIGGTETGVSFFVSANPTRPEIMAYFTTAAAEGASQTWEIVSFAAQRIEAATPDGYLANDEGAMYVSEEGYAIYYSEDGATLKIGGETMTVDEFAANGGQRVLLNSYANSVAYDVFN
jgi:Flp pilus assembly pilin Flp